MGSACGLSTRRSIFSPLPVTAVLREGMLYLNPGKWRWAKKGSQHVETGLKEDKRQFTGDVVHTGAGDVLIVEMITSGKTERSMPFIEVRRRHPRMSFKVTSNHWANHDTKVVLMGEIWQKVVAATARDKGISMEAARGVARCFVVLDCWPVNLTDKFKKEVKAACPGMTLMYIPAGATGMWQVRAAAVAVRPVQSTLSSVPRFRPRSTHRADQ